jgi:hypothetical protein
VKAKLHGGGRIASGARVKSSSLSVAQKISRITTWVEIQARTIIEKGRPLGHDEFQLAQRLGVQHPEEVLVLAVAALPLPGEARLRQAVEEFQLITSSTTSLTIGYNVFLRSDSLNEPVTSSELLQVAQCEKLEGIARFYKKYLLKIGKQPGPSAPIRRVAQVISAHALPRLV